MWNDSNRFTSHRRVWRILIRSKHRIDPPSNLIVALFLCSAYKVVLNTISFWTGFQLRKRLPASQVELVDSLGINTQFLFFDSGKTIDEEGLVSRALALLFNVISACLFPLVRLSRFSFASGPCATYPVSPRFQTSVSSSPAMAIKTSKGNRKLKLDIEKFGIRCEINFSSFLFAIKLKWSVSELRWSGTSMLDEEKVIQVWLFFSFFLFHFCNIITIWTVNECILVMHHVRRA